jgi:PAS domain S-box-containing protein
MTRASQNGTSAAPDAGSTPSARAAWLIGLLWTIVIAALAGTVLFLRLDAVREEGHASADVRLASTNDTLAIAFRQLAALPTSLGRRHAVVELLQTRHRPDLDARSPAEQAARYAAYRQDPAVRAMHEELEAVARDFGVPFIAVIDAAGEVIASTPLGTAPATTRPPSLGSREYFQRAMAAGSGSQFLFGRVSGVPGVYFATRIDAPGGRPVGVAVVKQDADVLTRLLGTRSEAIVLVTDEHGVVVLANRAEALLNRLPAARPTAAPTDPKPLYQREPGTLPWTTRPARLGRHESMVAEVDGLRHVVRSASLPGLPFTTWVLGPLGDESQVRKEIGVAALAAWAFGIALLWFGWRRLQLLSDALQARREIGELAQALPLTVFRYEQPLGGTGHFNFIGHGAERLFGVDTATLDADPTLPWRLAGRDDGRPPVEPQEFSVWRDGKRAWVLAQSTPRAAPDGGTTYNGYWLDITARRESEARFAAVFEHTSDAYLFFDREHGITRCNPAAARLFGAASPGELHGRIPWFPTMSPERQPDGEPSRERALKLMVEHTRSRARVQDCEWRFQRSDGSLFDAEVSVIAIEWDGAPQFCAVIQDVTARKQAEAAMRDARRAAEEASRSKSAFLANMSHELRTPMNAIIGMTHLALEDGLPDRQRDYVEKAHGAARNLLEILNDILDVSKIEAGRMELERIDFELEAVLGEMADVLGLKAEQKGLELVFSASPDLPRRLVGDPTRLRQVLVNLGSNAIKFTERGEVTVGMDLVSQTGQEVELHVWVRDTGIGMGPRERQRLFQPFAQGDNSTTRRYGGSGLGLVICRDLVERMGGRLWFDSEPGQGSTFHFSARFGRSVPRAPSRAWMVGELRGRRALLVDDNPAALEALGRMLETLGVQVDRAGSGAEALVRFDARGTTDYAWVLIDWKMPAMDGVACARAILARQAPVAPCILLVTAFGREEALRAASGVALAGVLQKPVTPSSLYDSLLQACQGSARPSPVPPPEGPAIEAARRRLAGARLLLVEDHPLNQQLATELLRRAGMDVVVAVDGQQALDRLADAGPFDGVLMDCQMPVMDGYTATERLRADPAHADLPVIAMTASALPEDRARALAAGMNAHIAKPLDVQVMLRTMAQWIAGRPQREAPAAPPPPAPWPPADAVSAIDTADGLARCIGKPELYRRLLHGFREAKQDLPARLRDAIEDDQLASLHGRLHDLKGLAGTIGARELHRSVLALQAALSRPAGAESGPGDVEAAAREVIDRLEQVLQDIDVLVRAG